MFLISITQRQQLLMEQDLLKNEFEIMELEKSKFDNDYYYS